jgi:hypothetical protein
MIPVKISVLLSSALLMLFDVSTANAQVQLLWTSPLTVGQKGLIWEVGSGKVRYCVVIDTSTHQCNLYDADNFSLTYTITNIGTYDYPYYCVPDMNGNGHPEVIFTGGQVRIIDPSTGTVIYSWPASYTLLGWFTTPMSNTIRFVFQNPSAGSNSLVVYSLGITTQAGQENNAGTLPNHVTVQQNFPNPFNPSTMIRYSMNHADHVSVEVFDINGKLVKTLLSERQEQGEHFTSWDGSGNGTSIVSSGTYFYTVTIGNEIQTRKMILLK